MGLGARLALVFACVVAATAFLIGGASYLTTDRQVTEEVDRFLNNRAKEIVAGQRQPPRVQNDRPATEVNASELTVEPDAQVQLLDGSGEVTSRSDLVLPIDARDLATAERKESDYLRTVEIDGVEFRMLTVHIDGGGAVQIARSLEEANSLLALLRGRLLAIAAAMAALGAAVGWLTASRTTRPLRQLTEAVDAVAQTQDFAVPIQTGGSSEVARLGAGFDRMLGELRLSQEQQRRLVQDAAHELRTPLTSIKANVDWLLRARGMDEDTRQDTMQSVGSELNELNVLIDEIIDLAIDRHELPPFEQLDLADVADAAVARFRTRVDRDVHVEASSTVVLGDFDTLRRAIANLLSNADKYSPAGTPIVVEIGNGGVWVSDQGSGIPTNERSRVFDRFYRGTANQSQPGSGLGLAIVSSIVEAHGGRVLITDAVGGGARVGFEFDSVAGPNS